MRGRTAVLSGVVAVTALGVTGLATASALQAADALDGARKHLAGLGGGSTFDAATESLRRADGELVAADEALSRWPVDILAAVPVLGRSWAAERAVVGASQEVVDAARIVGEQLPSVRAGAGGVDLPALDRLRSDLQGPFERSAEAYAVLEDQPLGLTPLQVSDGVTQARDALGPAVAALNRADAGISVVSGLLGAEGPRSVLVMLQNNAELRGTGGYTSSFATGKTQDGRLLLDPLQDLIEVADPPDEDHYLPAPEEYAEDYRMLGGNSTMWRTWNMSPHVPDSALVGARIAEAVLGQAPDVVVLLDVPAMGALAALGGTTIALPDGSSVEPSELTEALLVDSYAAAGADIEAQIRRRVQLQAAASAAVGRLLGGDVATAELVGTLVRLADQRHLTVWSARPDEQAALGRLGVAGELLPPAGGDLLHASVNNIGANKLDVYVDRAVSIAAEVGPRSVTVTQRVRFTNTAPADLVPYVAGAERPGVVVSRVELSLPPSAEDLAATVDDAPWNGALHTGGGRSRLITKVVLPRGASSVLEARYTLPISSGRYHLRLVPQPLVEDAALEVTVSGTDGKRLDVVSGAEESAGKVMERGPFRETRALVIQLPRPELSRWERLKRWWSSPVGIKF